MINGLYILLTVVLAAITFGCGYMCGETNEKERSIKELKEMNRIINEIQEKVEKIKG
jgi:hypothetical protein